MLYNCSHLAEHSTICVNLEAHFHISNFVQEDVEGHQQIHFYPLYNYFVSQHVHNASSEHYKMKYGRCLIEQWNASCTTVVYS